VTTDRATIVRRAGTTDPVMTDPATTDRVMTGPVMFARPGGTTAHDATTDPGTTDRPAGTTGRAAKIASGLRPVAARPA
jgi:hypothetical protein